VPTEDFGIRIRMPVAAIGTAAEELRVLLVRLATTGSWHYCYDAADS